MSIDFPSSLKLSRLQHASNVLLHLRSREDLNLGHIGEVLQPILAGYRKILPEYVDNFYELMYTFIRHLNLYCDLAESCSKSGAYQDRRQTSLNDMLAVLTKLERDPDFIRTLTAMQRQ